MGKRIKTKRRMIKARPKELKTVFDCPFCFQKESVSVKKEKKNYIAVISCFMCRAYYKAKYHDLTEPIDVYTEWIDACDELNRD